MLQIDFTLVFFAASFLVFIFLLDLVLYKPVGRVIEARKDLVEGGFSQSKELSEKADELMEKYKAALKRARIESQNLIQEVVLQAQKLKEEKIQKLVEELNKDKEVVLTQIKKEKEAANKEIVNKINILTELITAIVLGAGGEKERTLVNPL